MNFDYEVIFVWLEGYFGNCFISKELQFKVNLSKGII